MFLEQREIYSYNNLNVRSLHMAHMSQKVTHILIYLNTLCKLLSMGIKVQMLVFLVLLTFRTIKNVGWHLTDILVHGQPKQHVGALDFWLSSNCLRVTSYQIQKEKNIASLACTGEKVQTWRGEWQYSRDRNHVEWTFRALAMSKKVLITGFY